MSGHTKTHSRKLLSSGSPLVFGRNATKNGDYEVMGPPPHEASSAFWQVTARASIFSVWMMAGFW
jgi:hypothetical protein